MNEVMLAAFQSELEKIAGGGLEKDAFFGKVLAAGKKMLGGLTKGKGVSSAAMNIPKATPKAKPAMVSSAPWSKTRTATGPKIRTSSIAPTTMGTYRTSSARAGVSSKGSSGWGLAPASKGSLKKASANVSSQDIVMAAFLEELEILGVDMEKDAFIGKLVGQASKMLKGLGRGKAAVAPIVDRAAVAKRLTKAPTVKPQSMSRAMAPAQAKRIRETSSYLKSTRAADAAGTRLGGPSLPFFPKGLAGRAN